MIPACIRSASLATLVAAAACTGAACGPRTGPSQPLPAGGHHVLFIGNSLTYTNDLPGTVAALAAAVGDTIRVASVTAPDFALIDHLNSGSAVSAIEAGGWEYVVLQQGPSTVDVNRDSLVLWTKLFDPYVRAAGARTALFMVWPDATRRDFFDACRIAYQTAASAVNGLFLPAGAAWVAAWDADSSLALYGPDGYHPSPLGTYLAALVMYEGITGHDARALPATAAVGGLPLAADSQTVRLLQRAAHQADLSYPSH